MNVTQKQVTRHFKEGSIPAKTLGTVFFFCEVQLHFTGKPLVDS